MIRSFRRMSLRGKVKLLKWVVFGTLPCLAVSVGYNWYSFSGQSPDVFAKAMNSAVVLPLLLAAPLFFYLTMKLRELAIVNHKLHDLASRDQMTHCLNRTTFTDETARTAGQTSLQGALLLLDIDHFKRINDSYGHHFGDDALVMVSNAIQGAVRQGDLVGRLGGEEFGVFITATERSLAMLVAERIRKNVEDLVFEPAPGERLRITISIGGSLYGPEDDFTEIFRRADALLYEAKESGRNCIRFHPVEVDAPTMAMA